MGARYFVPLCLVAAFVVRVCWIRCVDAAPVSDFGWYYERGIDLSAGKGYSVDGIPTAYWPVGYPAFLGLLLRVFGTSLLVPKAANVIVSIGVLLLSYYMAKKLFRSELAGRATLLILSFYPNHIAYCSLVGSEIIFVFLLLLGVLLLISSGRKAWLVPVSGIVFGLACLVKPQTILVPMVVAGSGTMRCVRSRGLRRRLVSFAGLYIVLAITLLPWTVRNYRLFDDFVYVSNNGGINLLIGNNPCANGRYVFSDEMDAMLEDAQTERERDVLARTLAVRYAAAHPVRTIKLWPAKLWFLYASDVEGISWNEAGLGSPGGLSRVVFWVLKAIAHVYYLAVGSAFLLSISLLRFRRSTKLASFPTLGLWIVIYFTVVVLATFGGSRFHFPMIPWIAMYAGALADILLRSPSSRAA